MSEEQSMRLSKAAKEFNVSLDHIVDTLGQHGIKVEKNPNAKITPQAIAILQQTFQPDKIAKQSAIEITKEKQRQQNLVIDTPKEPLVTTSRITHIETETDEDLKRELDNIKKASAEKKGSAPEPVKKREKIKPAEEPKKEPELIKAKADKIEAPKILDKIDLDSVEKQKKVKGKKKKEEVAESENETEKPAKKKSKSKKEETEAETEEIVIPDAPKVEEITPVISETKEPSTEEELPADDNVEIFRTEREKLSGPTILGKIDLPVDPPKKKPVASSLGSPVDRDNRKKKRKRTDKKVNIAEVSKQIVDKDRTPSADWKQKRDSRPGGGGYQGRRQRETPKQEPTEKEIQDQIKATLARLSGSGKSKSAKMRKMKREERAQEAEILAQEEATKKVIKVTEFVSANELARLIGVPITDIISTCMSLGLFVSINQRLDAETITVVAEEFGYKIEFVSADVQEAIEDKVDTADELKQRAPIVTVMGHVDHGKTSLLDFVRSANVIAGEAGGITQHIGAYEVTLQDGRHITFLDTPGHEAFTAMRARGAKLTDVAIIVIAADDSVMPQTVEAINHAQAAAVPIVFAFNKMDKPDANADRLREQLSKMNIMVEEWGGKYQTQEISAKKGLNLDKLLDKVLLEAELLDLQANPNRNAKGTVIEASLDKGRGYVTTLLVQTGTLKIGDVVLAGCHSGRVKAMFNERGARVKEAGPSVPVSILGLSGAPQAGDQFNVMEDEREARDIANRRLQLQREQGIRTHKHITLDEIGRRLAIGNFKELNLIVKGDVDGSVEALADSLLKLSNPEIQVNVIHKSVGAITESDVLLASASNAIIVGFQVRPSVSARRLAEQEQIDIRMYSIIYDAINEVKDAMEGMLAPEYEEKITSNIEIREVFKIPKVGAVAGCMVLDGKITRNTKVRIIREGIVVFSGELNSLKRFKDDAKEVSAGFECGLSINNYNDIKVGDIVEGYEQVAVKRTLA